jgi:hypothetical protein
VPIFGKDGKRAFTVLLGCTTDGQLLPLQTIYTGLMGASPEQRAETGSRAYWSFIYYRRKTYWSTIVSMEEYFTNIMGGHRTKIIAQHSLPPDSKVLLYYDCWALHRPQELREIIKKLGWLELVFVPGGCIGLYQPCDVGIQHIFKHHVKNSVSEFFTSQIEKSVEEGTAPENIKLDISLATLRNETPEWLCAAYNIVSSNLELVKKAWSKCKIGPEGRWDLSYECLTSEEAKEAFFALYDEEDQSYVNMIKGEVDQAVVRKRKPRKGNKAGSQLQITAAYQPQHGQNTEEDDDEEEAEAGFNNNGDADDVPLEIVVQSVLTDTDSNDCGGHGLPAGYKLRRSGRLGAQALVYYEESDSEDSSEDEGSEDDSEDAD